MSHELDLTRALDQATQRDEKGRYYRTEHDGVRVFGYHAWQTGAWICYTDGAYCACLEWMEEVSA